MADPKYTPGPWRVHGEIVDADGAVCGYRVEDSRGLNVGSVEIFELGDKHAEAEAFADVHLFAAAPELLDALKRMLDRYDPDLDEHNDTVADARDAVAKAEGRIDG